MLAPCARRSFADTTSITTRWVRTTTLCARFVRRRMRSRRMAIREPIWPQRRARSSCASLVCAIQPGYCHSILHVQAEVCDAWRVAGSACHFWVAGWFGCHIHILRRLDCSMKLLFDGSTSWTSDGSSQKGRIPIPVKTCQSELFGGKLAAAESPTRRLSTQTDS